MEFIVRVTCEPLDAAAVAELERAVEIPSVGGIVTFQGVVRDTVRVSAPLPGI